MNKSMLMGVVAGIGVATAGGVLGYQFLGERSRGKVTRSPSRPRPRHTRRRHPRRTAAARPHGCGRSSRRVLGRGSPGDGRPQGSSIGSRAPRSAPSSAARSARTSATATSRRRPVRQPVLSSAARSRSAVQENRADQRTTTTVERRCGPPGQRSSLSSQLRLDSGPDRRRFGPFLFASASGRRPANANDLQQQSRLRYAGSSHPRRTCRHGSLDDLLDSPRLRRGHGPRRADDVRDGRAS